MGMIFDRAHDQKCKLSIKPQALVSAKAGDYIVDTAGYKAAIVYVAAGTITDQTSYPFIIEVGNDSGLSDAVTADHASGFLLDDMVTPDGSTSDQSPGTVASVTTSNLIFLQASDGNKIKRMGVVSPYRYMRVSLSTVTAPKPKDAKEGGLKGAAVGGIFTAWVELLEPARKPVVQD